jgi:hypothetical protein
MSKKTTVKTVALGYRAVGSSGEYTPLMGVLRGLTIAQDEPDATNIEAEFFDAPFTILYQGNPVTFTFELANYDLDELPNLFGGSYDSATDTYEAATGAHTSEWEWKLDFQQGNSALKLYKGLTVGTIKKDEDGALNYSVTITALNYNDGTDDPESVQVNVGRWFIIESGTGVSFNRTFSAGDEISFVVIKNVIGGNVMTLAGVASTLISGNVTDTVHGTAEPLEV